MATPFFNLQQFPIKRTTVKNLKGLRSNPFKFFTGSGLIAKHRLSSQIN